MYVYSMRELYIKPGPDYLKISQKFYISVVKHVTNPELMGFGDKNWT